MLNTLKEIDYSVEKFSVIQYWLFNQCLIFSGKPSVTSELINIFQSIDNISISCQRELFFNLVMIVKYHFKDDIKKTRELLSMLVKSMDKEVLVNLPNFVDDRVENIELKEKIAKMEIERQEEISKLKDEISKLKDKS